MQQKLEKQTKDELNKTFKNVKYWGEGMDTKKRYFSLSPAFKSSQLLTCFINEIVSRNKYEKTMETRTNSPGVGKYKPKYETILPRTIVSIFQSLDHKTHPRRKNKKYKLCKRLFRVADVNSTTKSKTKNISSNNRLLSPVSRVSAQKDHLRPMSPNPKSLKTFGGLSSRPLSGKYWSYLPFILCYAAIPRSNRSHPFRNQSNLYFITFC